jgi:hypothetical protein
MEDILGAPHPIGCGRSVGCLQPFEALDEVALDRLQVGGGHDAEPVPAGDVDEHTLLGDRGRERPGSGPVHCGERLAFDVARHLPWEETFRHRYQTTRRARLHRPGDGLQLEVTP